MKSFEPVYKELETLFIEKLPEYIDKVNKNHNDGIILKPFENQTLQEKCIKQPCFVFGIEEVEYSEKDRIIENTIYEISLEINTHPNLEQKTIIIYRYFEAINNMISENETNAIYIIKNIIRNKIYIRIIF